MGHCTSIQHKDQSNNVQKKEIKTRVVNNLKNINFVDEINTPQINNKNNIHVTNKKSHNTIRFNSTPLKNTKSPAKQKPHSLKSSGRSPVTSTQGTFTSNTAMYGSARDFGTFYSDTHLEEIAAEYENVNLSSVDETEQESIVQYYHDNYYGQSEVFTSPFGARPVLYCDWTASGKNLRCVEKYISDEVKSLYANTHTTTSITGRQTTKFRTEARGIILKSLKGDIEEDVVVFCGSGVTGCIYKLANIILVNTVIEQHRPESTVVFVSIYEHNSNLIIWKELGCKLVLINENPDKNKGGIDLNMLEEKLKYYTTDEMKRCYNLLIGSFTAASNVSGIIAPIDETTELLHRYDALSFWDYATAGPYLDINMSNKEHPELSKDAVFLSTHKFLGGPNSPGVLCAKKRLFSNYVPIIPGGGTVFIAWGFDDEKYEFLENISEKEEGGTPDIIGSIRAAFVFMIKDRISTKFIENRERQYFNYFVQQIKGINNLKMIGNMKCNRLPILSFNVQYKSKLLHQNYIAVLFNDLFGIQGRSGCSCAGMYSVYELKLSDEKMQQLMAQAKAQNELARPGHYRINLHYTLTWNELEYIVKAIKYVCKNGWKFLPLYDVDSMSGNFQFRNWQQKPQQELRSLLEVKFDSTDARMKWKSRHSSMTVQSLQENLNLFFKMADHILDHLDQHLPLEYTKNEHVIHDPDSWYWLPSEL
eukprot:461161_1